MAASPDEFQKAVEAVVVLRAAGLARFLVSAPFGPSYVRVMLDYNEPRVRELVEAQGFSLDRLGATHREMNEVVTAVVEGQDAKAVSRVVAEMHDEEADEHTAVGLGRPE